MKSIKRRALFICFVIASGFSSEIYSQDGTLGYGTSREAGMSAGLLREAAGIYEEAVRNDDIRGAVLLVAREGKIVLHEALGWRNKEENLPMEKNTMFRMASNTKPVITAAVNILADEKKLNVHDLARKYVPSFDNYRSGFISIHHLMTHTAGFRLGVIFYSPLLQSSAEYADTPSLRAEVDRFGEMGAEVIPGTAFSYSNPGYNTLGAIVEAVSGKPLEAFLKERIYAPLQMCDSYHHEIAEKLDGKLSRMSVVYRKKNGEWHPAWKPGDPPDYPFVRASGGMISTALDYAAFCQMLLNGGSYGGRRILSDTSVAAMTAPQTLHLLKSGGLGEGENYGYGWFIAEDGVYSHGGSDGTFAWVDPSKKLIGIIFTQSPGGRNPQKRFIELINTAIESGKDAGAP